MKKNMLVARISNPYGPGQDYHKGVGFIDAAIKRALANETIEIWGDGNVVRDYIYIDDVCRMLYKLIDYKGEYEVFNLISNTGTSQNEIVDAIKKMEPKLEVKYLPARNVDAKKIILDNSRIMEIDDFDLTELHIGIRNYYEYTRQCIGKGV